jgi:hypothetical protein
VRSFKEAAGLGCSIDERYLQIRVSIANRK